MEPNLIIVRKYNLTRRTENERLKNYPFKHIPQLVRYLLVSHIEKGFSFQSNT